MHTHQKINTPEGPNRKKLLNVGCGSRYHGDWINIDFIATGENVQKHDLKKGIPYPDNAFDVIYHSHVLEHFTKADAMNFVKECYRLLKPGGIIRIAVPDLEVIAKNYLSFLESASVGDALSEANYDWTMLEMYDQTVRNHREGEMKEYFEKKDILNKDFIKKRMGCFFEIMAEKKVGQIKNTWKTHIKRFVPVGQIKKIFKSVKDNLPGEKHRELGKFRMSGEIHQWMYDRFSLARLLKNTGFNGIIQRSATDSYIENWARYNLDSEPDGSTYKPDSLFMEARK